MAIDVQKSVESPLDAAIILLLILLAFVVVAILGFHTIPNQNLPIFAAFSAAAVTGPLGVYFGFRWGSNKASQQKDQTIATMAAKDNNS